MKAGQQLFCGYNGTVRITDGDFNTLKEMAVEGLPVLPAGETEVTFTCEARGADKLPEVRVRYQTRETPMPLMVPVKREPEDPMD